MKIGNDIINDDISDDIIYDDKNNNIIDDVTLVMEDNIINKCHLCQIFLHFFHLIQLKFQ